MPLILRRTGNPPFEKRLSFANELAFVLGKKIRKSNPQLVPNALWADKKDFQNYNRITF
jgi:hypothetical protein